MTVVVTACSSRKRVPASPQLQARDLEPGRPESVAFRWLSRLSSAKPERRARELYCGRGFFEAVHAARDAQAPLYVVSAGLGFVHEEDILPAYSLTVAPGSPDSILASCEGGAGARDWWALGASQSPFSRNLTRTLADLDRPGQQFLLALPGTYLRMIGHELVRLPDALLSRIRIFSGMPSSGMHPRLAPFLMPYDGRLNGKDSSAPGTQSDFAARALADFTAWVLPDLADGTAEEHRDAVSRRLQEWSPTTRPDRPRQSDEALLTLIRQNWKSGQSSASRMLRTFRDDLGIACEQKRFGGLFSRVQDEMEREA